MSGYKGGRIARISMKNFMTYDTLECFPKPGLNFILGLNGTGKSSIMCAICLVLGGKPQHTGRTSNLKDFIKHGKHKATIEIELENLGRRNITISRTIVEDKTTWLLNGRPVQPLEVLNTVKKFNIDVSNLCQFLPQEKVTEFSKMDKKQRLENMLQAIGEPLLYEEFQKLIQLRIKFNEKETELKKFDGEKSEVAKLRDRLQGEVQKHTEREDLKNSIKEKENQLKIREYLIMKDDVEDLKKKLIERKKFLKDSGDRLEEIGEKQNIKISECNGLKKSISALGIKCRDFHKRLGANGKDLSDFQEKIEKAKIHFRNRLAEKETQETKLETLRVQVVALKKKLKDFHEQKEKLKVEIPKNKLEFEHYQGKLAQVHEQIDEVTQHYKKLEYSARNCEQNIENLKNTEKEKLQFLRYNNRDAYEGVIWLEANRNLFKGEVCLPALISIQVTDAENLKYIENHVGRRDLVAFVCEEKDDIQLLTNVLKNEKNLKVNLILSERKQEPLSIPISPEMRQLGILTFLKDLFKAPAPIMRFLCFNYGVHKVPICRYVSPNNFDRLLEHYSSFFVDGEKVTGKRSKYGDRNMTVKRDTISARGTFPNTKDVSEDIKKHNLLLWQIINEKQGYEGQLKELKQKQENLEKGFEQIRNQKQALQALVQEIRKTEIDHAQKSDYWDRKQNEIIDVEQEKKTLSATVKALNVDRLVTFETMNNLLKMYNEAKTERLKNMLLAGFLSREIDRVKLQKDELQKEYNELEGEVNQLTEMKNKRIAEAKKLFDVIKQIIPEDPAIRKNYMRLLKSAEELKNMIAEIQAKLDMNSDVDEKAVLDFRTANDQIEKLDHSLEDVKNTLQKMRAESDERKKKWLASFEDIHIKNVNQKFSQYYQKLQCAGEICLDKGEDSDDFTKYGLQILLKYRDNESMQELSQNRHSGGECAVAAIIFILSLQGLTEVPFRCIDEINQGMDSFNERTVYSLIADAADSGACSQYFLLTPSLLSDLEFNKKVNYAVIHNAQHLATQMNVKGHKQILRDLNVQQ